MTEVGEVVDGRYRLDAFAGSGAMGDVFRATRVTDGRTAAVKLLSQNVVEASTTERFLREIRLVARLDHPGIAKVLDAGEHRGRPYLAIEWVEGGTLWEWVKRGALGWRAAANFGKQIAHALGAAHALGIVHRDVKPTNIMVDATTGDVRLVDFGVALAADQERLTKTGVPIGTAEYMAPEQAKAGAVGPAADLYALGVVLYEMLTGRLPFEGSGFGAMVLKLQERAPSARLLAPSSVPLEFCDLVDRLLDPAPETRPADALSVHEALKRIERLPERTAQRPPTIVEGAPQAPPPSRAMPRVALAIFGLFGLALLVAAGALLLGEPPETPPPASPSATSDRGAHVTSATSTAGTQVAAPRLAPEDLGSPDAIPDAGVDPDSTTPDAADELFSSRGCQQSPPFDGPRTLASSDDVGRTFEWVVYLPAGYDWERPHRTLVLLHDSGLDPTYMVKTRRMNEVADEHDLVLIVPRAQKMVRSWREPYEPAFVRRAVLETSKLVCLDPKWLYVMGVGAGGGLLEHDLPCSMPFSAIASVSWRAAKGDTICARNPSPRLSIVADGDPGAPVEGGFVDVRGDMASQEQHVAVWRQAHGCRDTPDRTWKVTDGTCEEWSSCENAPLVVCTPHGGRSWAGETVTVDMLAPFIKMKPQGGTDFPYREAIWEFFEEHGRPLPTR